MQSKTGKATAFDEWASETTAHGFLDYSKSKSVIGKAIWFFLIFLSLMLMVYQLYRVTNDYLKHEWITTIQEKASDTGQAELPKIIICNINRLKWSKAIKYNLTLDLIDFLFHQFQSMNIFPKGLQNFSTVEQFGAWRRAHNLTYLKIFEQIGPSFSDIFIENPIAAENLTTEIDAIQTYEFGRCQRLNLNFNASLVGSLGGVSMVLDVQSWDYIPLLYNNYPSEGLVIQFSYAGNAEIGQWIKLHPGTHTSIALRGVKSTVRLQDRSTFNPFNFLDSDPPCTLAPTMRFLNNSQYSVTNCQLECSLANVVRGCNCVVLLQSEHFRTCEIEELMSCSPLLAVNVSNPEELQEAAHKYTEELVQCVANCVMPCYDRSVETDVSMAKFPSGRQRPQMKEYLKNKNLTRVQMEDIILLEIYFGSLTTKVIERYEAVNFEDLISDTGGLIGVWAGMSFLTIFQAISFLINYFVERKKNKLSEIKSAPANCVDFMASDDPGIAAGGGNVGTLTCETTGGFACLSGTWMGSAPGKWEATNLGTADPNTMGIFSYCSSPGVCKIFIGDSFDPNGILPDRQYTLVYKDGPTKTYVQPEFGDFDPMTTDGSNNFLISDICCGTCADCVAAGCNPPL
uniref:Uncharacterized protein n=1 Tax=Plectus sambesii TaxID=2011161 RepID=A0A914XHA3_9BILA